MGGDLEEAQVGRALATRLTKLHMGTIFEPHNLHAQLRSIDGDISASLRLSHQMQHDTQDSSSGFSCPGWELFDDLEPSQDLMRHLEDGQKPLMRERATIRKRRKTSSKRSQPLAIVKYSREERQAAVERYRLKRKRRLEAPNNGPRYHKMKAVADGKKRSSSGKFVKKSELAKAPISMEIPWTCTDDFTSALA